MIKEVKTNVHNCPENAGRFIVAKLVGGIFWFWGSWDTVEGANTCVRELMDSGIECATVLINE